MTEGLLLMFFKQQQQEHTKWVLVYRHTAYRHTSYRLYITLCHLKPAT